jgi:hypothetical protein
VAARSTNAIRLPRIPATPAIPESFRTKRYPC